MFRFLTAVEYVTCFASVCSMLWISSEHQWLWRCGCVSWFVNAFNLPAVIFFFSETLSDKKRRYGGGSVGRQSRSNTESGDGVLLSCFYLQQFLQGHFLPFHIVWSLYYRKNIFWQDINPCRWLRMVLSYQSNSSFKKKNCSTFFPEHLFLLDQHLLFEDYILNSHPFLSHLQVGSQFE